MNLFEEIDPTNRRNGCIMGSVGLDKWKEAFGIPPEKRSVRFCQIQYNAAKLLIFKKREIDYSSVSHAILPLRDSTRPLEPQFAGIRFPSSMIRSSGLVALFRFVGRARFDCFYSSVK